MALAPIEQEIQNIVKFIAQGKGSPALAGELERLEIQKKEIEGEMGRITFEAQELKNRTINAEIVAEGLGFFEQAWQVATPKQKKDLMRLHIHRIIWSPQKIKMGLYLRPTSEMYVKSTAVNHIGDFAVDSMNWLPEPDTKLTQKAQIIRLLVAMYKYRGRHTQIVFGEPLPAKTIPPKPVPKNIVAEALKVKVFL